MISVVICHHTGELYKSCIDSIKWSKLVHYEIILITSDYTLAIQGIPGVHILHSNDLPARKRNLAAYTARGEYLAFLDDDVEIKDDCLYQLRNTLETRDCSMAYAKCLKSDEPHRLDEAGGYLTPTGFIWSRAGQNIVDKGQYDKDTPILAGKSACCMIRSTDFHEVEGFDEDFGILGEETDLSWRLWLRMKESYFSYRAIAYHHFNTPLKPPAQYYTSTRVHRNGPRNYVTMLLKNLGAKRLCLTLPIHILLWTLSGLSLLCTLRIKAGLNVLRGLLESLLLLPFTLRKRHVVQSARLIDDPYLLAIIGRGVGLPYYTQRFFRYITGGLHG